MVDWAPGEKAKIQAKITAAMKEIVKRKVGDKTIAEVMTMMKGQ